MRPILTFLISSIFAFSQVASAFSSTSQASVLAREGVQSIQFAGPLNLTQLSRQPIFKGFDEAFGASIEIPAVTWQQNSAYLAGLKEPLVFAPNFQSFSYRGVEFKWSQQQPPSKNFSRFKETFKKFPELGIPKPGRAGLWVGRAYADVGPIYQAMGFFAGAVVIGVAAVVVGLAYAVYKFSNKLNQAPELRCTPSPLLVVDGAPITVDASKKAEITKSIEEICKNPQSVEQFNSYSKEIRRQVASGEVKLSSPSSTATSLEPVKTDKGSATR